MAKAPCSSCAARKKAARKRIERDLAEAEALSAQGKYKQAALMQLRAKALRHGISVVAIAGKALGIHGEVEDERTETEVELPQTYSRRTE